MKWQKMFFCCICFLLCCVIFFPASNSEFTASAEETQQPSENPSEKLEETIDEGLQNIDFSDFDDILSSLGQAVFSIKSTKFCLVMLVTILEVYCLASLT